MGQLTFIRMTSTQIFNDSEEGRAYAKLCFAAYTPKHFGDDSETLLQVKSICESNGRLIVGNMDYKMMWYGDRDCMTASLTTVCPQLLPIGFSKAGLRIKYNLNTMINQSYRMRH